MSYLFQPVFRAGVLNYFRVDSQLIHCSLTIVNSIKICFIVSRPSHLGQRGFIFKPIAWRWLLVGSLLCLHNQRKFFSLSRQLRCHIHEKFLVVGGLESMLIPVTSQEDLTVKFPVCVWIQNGLSGVLEVRE